MKKIVPCIHFCPKEDIDARQDYYLEDGTTHDLLLEILLEILACEDGPEQKG